MRHDQPVVPADNDRFFNGTAIDELARGAKPLERIEDLTIEDLTPDEAQAFLDAIKE